MARSLVSLTLGAALALGGTAWAQQGTITGATTRLSYDRSSSESSSIQITPNHILGAVASRVRRVSNPTEAFQKLIEKLPESKKGFVPYLVHAASKGSPENAAAFASIGASKAPEHAGNIAFMASRVEGVDANAVVKTLALNPAVRGSSSAVGRGSALEDVVIGASRGSPDTPFSQVDGLSPQAKGAAENYGKNLAATRVYTDIASVDEQTTINSEDYDMTIASTLDQGNDDVNSIRVKTGVDENGISTWRYLDLADGNLEALLFEISTPAANQVTTNFTEGASLQ